MHVINSASTIFTLSAADQLLPIIGWNNTVSLTTITSTSADDGYPVTNLANPATHLIWRGISTTANEVITVNSSSEDEIDYVAIARHNFGSANIPLIISADEGSGYIEQIGVTTLADDSPYIFRFESRNWTSVKITLIQGSDQPELAVLYVGKLIQLERSIKVDTRHSPFNLWQVSKQVTAKSESGHFLGRVLLSRKAQSVADFEHIDQTWYRAHLQDFVEGAQTDPFFFAWVPSEYSDDVGYAWLTEDAKPEIDPVTRRVAIQLKMEGLIV